MIKSRLRKVEFTQLAGARVKSILFSREVMPNSLATHGLYVAHQAPLSMAFPRQEYLEWVAISLSRERVNLKSSDHKKKKKTNCN